MKTKKPDRSVAQMAVLRDIRGLLSLNQEQALQAETNPEAEEFKKAENGGLVEQLKQYEELVRKQQSALDRLEDEKKEMEAKIDKLQSTVDKLSTPKSDKSNDKISSEISELEARKDELSVALSQVEAMLQFKIKELARRIAQVYQEAGDISANRDFRRITDQLEADENFGEFIRALLRG